MGLRITGTINCFSKKWKNKSIFSKSTSSILTISLTAWLFSKTSRKTIRNLNSFYCPLKRIHSIITLIWKIIWLNLFKDFQSMFCYSNFYLKKPQLIILIIKTLKLSFIVLKKSTPVTIKNLIKWSIISNWLNSKNKPSSHFMSQNLELNLSFKKMWPFLHHTTKSKMLFCTFSITE